MEIHVSIERKENLEGVIKVLEGLALQMPLLL
jgi:hypothetical protein